jgi:hypothetical protein
MYVCVYYLHLLYLIALSLIFICQNDEGMFFMTIV